MSDANVPERPCRTVLLEDVPATTDAFASDGDVGPHFRVAKALSDLIAETDGGKVIGLEGGWGAGKSTVVSLARALLERNDQPHVTMVLSFDAWAHEGDPLRRTYLETLIRAVRDKGWVDKDRWNNCLEEIAHRRRTAKTNTIPKPTRLGSVFALSLLLVPFGSAFLTAALRDSPTLDPSLPVSGKFLFGLLSVAPLFVVLGYILKLFIAGGFSKIGDLREWAVLEGRTITSTETETIEAPNPTSLEFEGYFEALMREALQDHPSRRIVLVVDNLDRVDPADALGIWSTLQTFLQYNDRRAEAWFKRLWVWVPFDPAGLRRLWAKSESNSESRVVSESFLDKSFQVRFSVPPLVVSDWREHLGELLSEALPDHLPEDQHEIYTVFGQFRENNSTPPTPRRLKLFVNQIGSIHRQWGDAFPISHVAYFVLVCGDRQAFIEDLRSARIPDEAAVRLLGNTLRGSLAGLLFNVSAGRGQEVLLADPIYGALSEGRPKELQKLASDHKAGFWLILESVALSRFHGSRGGALAQIAASLRDSGLMSQEGSRRELRSVRMSLLNAVREVSDGQWGVVDSVLVKGMCALVDLGRDAALTNGLLGNLRVLLAESPASSEIPEDHSELLPELLALIAYVEEIGHADSLGDPFVIHADMEAWQRLCNKLIEAEPDGKHWHLLKPVFGTPELVQSEISAVSGGRFAAGDIAVLKVAAAAANGDLISQVLDSIRDRLDLNKNIPAEEAMQLLSGLDQLRRSKNVHAEAIMRRVIEEGHLLHQYWRASKEGNSACRALCLFLFMTERVNGSNPGVSGTAEQGYQRLTQALESDDAALAEGVANLIFQRNEIKWVFAVADARGRMDPLLASVLRRIAEQDTGFRLLSADVLAEHWKHMLGALGSAAAEALVNAAVSSIDLRGELQRRNYPLSESTAALCRLLIGKSDAPPFVEWCARKLGELGAMDWKVDFIGDLQFCQLAVDVKPRGAAPALGIGFHDALLEHATDIADSRVAFKVGLAALWPMLLASIQPESLRGMFPKRLLRIMTSRNGEVSDEFIINYGAVLLDWEVLESNEELIPRVFANWLMSDRLVGLQWMLHVFSDVPQLWARDGALPMAEEFRIRLSERIRNPRGNDVDNIISEVDAIISVAGDSLAVTEVSESKLA